MQHGRTSFSAIAQEAGCTKQAVSQWMCNFRDELGFQVSAGKSTVARRAFAAAQYRAVKRGTHSSIRRKQRKAIKTANAACKAMLHSDDAMDVVSSAQ